MMVQDFFLFPESWKTHDCTAFADGVRHAHFSCPAVAYGWSFAALHELKSCRPGPP